MDMDSLPDEIILRILKLLNPIDVANFCQAYENRAYFMKEKEVIWKLNWSKQFELHNIDICKIMCKKMDSKLITSLNIDYLYWIPLKKLRKLVEKLENLEELHAVDTRFGLVKKDMKLYMKLKKLALSIARDNFSFTYTYKFPKKRVMPHIKSLCLKMYLTRSYHRQLVANLIIGSMKSLNELWIQEFISKRHRRNKYDIMINKLPNLKRVVLSYQRAGLPDYNFSHCGLTIVLHTERCQCASEIIFEKLDDQPDRPEPVMRSPVTLMEKIWRRYRVMQNFPSMGVKESKLFLLDEVPDNIQFEELDFCHSRFNCSYYFSKSSMELLNAPNTKNLKKLQIPSCLWLPTKKPKVQPEIDNQETDAEIIADLEAPPDDDEEEEYVIQIDRPRRGPPEDPPEQHPFFNTAMNLSELRELHIFTCTSYCHKPRNISSFQFLGAFKYLRKLLLKIHMSTEGRFLEDVFLQCTMLESLIVQCTTEDEDFMSHLCNGLKFSKSLKDFRLDFGELDINKLSSSIASITNKKLQRLVLKCNVLYLSRSTSVAEPFTNILESQKQLVLFYFIGRDLTRREMFRIKTTMRNHERSWKVVYASRKDLDFCYAHYDITRDKSTICGVDFNAF